MKRKIIFFHWGNIDEKASYASVIMKEAIELKKVKMYSKPLFLHKEKWANLHNDICCNWKQISFIFYHMYLPWKLSRKEKYIFLFNEWHPCLLNLDFFKWIKKIYDVKIVLVLWNKLNENRPAVQGVPLEKLKQIFDLIVTCERADEKKHNLLFLSVPFSPIKIMDSNIKNDICFIGSDKGRSKLLIKIAQNAKRNNISYNFKIVDRIKKKSILTYVNYQPYMEVIRQNMETNCILEILQKGQKTHSLRLQEAVCLGKKMLTNNQNVIYEKYYNPNYIQIFNNVDEINWDFVREKIKVDYEYKGEYSPLTFLKKIEDNI